jgi:DNA-binding transcriptional MerR regulator
VATKKNKRPAAAAAPEALMKTSEVLEKSGITRQMLYLYTTMGLVEPKEKTAAGHGLFDETVLSRLKIIRDALETGYSLRDVKEIFFEGSRRRKK